jgi:drug/metabolite transporter superfamily protein YnfA
LKHLKEISKPMTDHINKKLFGIFTMVASLLMWLIDRMTHAVSDMMGKIICGDQYMLPVNGTISDRSCGFDTDMHLAFSLVIVFLLGAALYRTSRKETI